MRNPKGNEYCCLEAKRIMNAPLLLPAKVGDL